MKTRIKTRRIISLMLSIAMIFGIIPAMPDLTTVSARTSEVYDEEDLELVWEPDLTGAKTLLPGGSNRNFVLDKDDNPLGMNVSSSVTNCISFGETGHNGVPLLRYENRGGSPRLNILVDGTGTNAGSPKGLGFQPELNKTYVLRFDAQNGEKTGPSNLNYKINAVDAGADSPVSGYDDDDYDYNYTFEQEFTYIGSTADGDSGNGYVAIGITSSGNAGTVNYFSNIRIYKVNFSDEKYVQKAEDLLVKANTKIPAPFRADVASTGTKEEAEAKAQAAVNKILTDQNGDVEGVVVGGEYLAGSADTAGYLMFSVDLKKNDATATVEDLKLVIAPPSIEIAKWEFTKANYPDTFPPAGVKELEATGGLLQDSSTIIRNHDKGYPDGSNTSGPLDHTNTLKHMDIDSAGWLRTTGWSTPENYIYLRIEEMNSAYEELILTYEIRATSTSTPTVLKLQFSYDGKEWFKVTGGNVEVRPPSTDIAVEAHLPLDSYNTDKLYLRWFGSNGSSTSGRIEFKNITLEQSILADPPPPVRFSHVNVVPGGKDLSTLRFSWFTEQGPVASNGDTDVAKIQFAKKADLIDGNFPEDPAAFNQPDGKFREIEGVNAKGSSLYETNKVEVGGLEKNTEYVYRVGDGRPDERDPRIQPWSPIYNVNTYDSDEAYTAIVVADPQISGGGAVRWADSLDKALTRVPDAPFIFCAGDCASDCNNPDLNEALVSPNELRNIPFATVYGNHDHQMAAEYEKIRYLPLLYNWPNTFRVVDGTQFDGHDYYFSYGNTLYIMLDSNVKNVDSHDPVMDAATKAHPDATWKIVTYHHDMYGASRHAGSYYGDSAAMQPTWGPYLDKWDIDIVFNGHDHLYARSKLMSGDNHIERFQMSAQFDVNAGFDREGDMIRNPGAYIDPKGIQYIEMSTAGDKFYELEMQTWIGLADEQSDQSEYSTLTIDGDSLTVKTYRIGATEEMTDSVTLRKTALYEDLDLMVNGDPANEIKGAKDFPATDINSGWQAFQDAIAAAQTVLAKGEAVATPAEVHSAFTNVYEKYFALKSSTDKAPLDTLIKEVVPTWEEASEGYYEGQYPPGSRRALKAVIEDAKTINTKYLANNAETAEVLGRLQTQYNGFKGSVSNIPIPWKVLHEVKASGTSKVDLIGWMNETVTTKRYGDLVPRYDSNLTKGNNADPEKGAFAQNSGGQRTQPRFGPANAFGGRGNADATGGGKPGGHITDTYIGEFIRYEINAEAAGYYTVKLGAQNPSNVINTVLMRDTNQNILAEFNVPANHENTKEWSESALVAAKNNQEVYLQKGRNIIELYFRNAGANVSSNTRYTDGPLVGPDLDILEFSPSTKSPQPAPPVPPANNASIYYLPTPSNPPLSASTTHSQRGWGITTHTDEHGTKGSIPVDIFKAAKAIVLEISTVKEPGGNNLQLVVMSDKNSWSTTAEIRPLSPHFDTTKKQIRLTAEKFPEQFAEMKNAENMGAILIPYYSTGWNEITVERAWLEIDADANPCKDGHQPKMDDNCTLCSRCKMFLTRTCTGDTPCVTHDGSKVCYPYYNSGKGGHKPTTNDCTKCGNTGCEITLERSCSKANPCNEHASADGILEQGTKTIKVQYQPDASADYLIWGDGNEYPFSRDYWTEGGNYKFEFSNIRINDDNVSKGSVTKDDLNMFIFGLSDASLNYQWTAVGQQIGFFDSNEIADIILSQEKLRFPYENLSNFGLQLTVNEDIQNSSKAGNGPFAAGDSVEVTFDYILSKPPTGCDCDLATCAICSENGKWRALGDVDDDENHEISIFDALEVLKYLVKMNGNIIPDKTKPTETDEASFEAAIISPQGVTAGEPTIFCALEILKFLVSMDSKVDGLHIHGDPTNTPVKS